MQYAITGSTAAVDVTAFLFPRNSSDAAAGLTYDAFQRATTQREVTSCLSRHGLPGPTPAPPAAAIANFPNLQLVKQDHALAYAPGSGNQGDVSYASPAEKMGKAEAKAYHAALGVCTKRVADVFAELNGQTGEAAAVYNQYSEIYQEITASRPVQVAGKAAQGCAARSGFHFDAIRGDYMLGAILGEESDVFRLQSERGKPAAIAQDAVDASVLARCLAPLDAVRGALLTRARAQLFANNALAIQWLQTEAQRVVGELLAHQ